MMADAEENTPALWRLVLIGGQTRNIGKTQLVCDVIRAFPKVNWTAGKITLNDDETGVQNADALGGAPTDSICALEWEAHADTGTDSAQFLAAGAKRAFWLRAKPGFLSECFPLLRQALREAAVAAGPGDSPKRALVVESNSLLQFVSPSLYFAVIDPDKEDFENSAQAALNRANALVLRAALATGKSPPAPLWMKVPPELLQQRPSVLQRVGEPLPRPLESLILQMLDDAPSVSF